MPSINIVRSSDVVRTARVMQVEGLFDVPPSKKSAVAWQVDLDLPAEWNVGVIVGPSGSGKSTLVRELFAEHLTRNWEWDAAKTILDGFAEGMPIKEITELLSSVGFSTPPSWLRPFHALSTGEQFRVGMARTLAEMRDLAVVDEFTSVIDRQVAQIGSAAIAKTVRRRRQKFIAVTCHYDVLDWLEPDWVYQPHLNKMYTGRSVHRRPSIRLEIRRVHTDAWQIFRHHHYLDAGLHKASRCFVAFVDGNPAAFGAVLHFPHPKVKNIWRGHRTVCLPDFQGVGIGNALSDTIGSMVRGLGWRYRSQTAHPGLIAARHKSPNWRMDRAPQITPKKGTTSGLSGRKGFGIDGWGKRLIAGFEFVGPPMDKAQALALWSGQDW